MLINNLGSLKAELARYIFHQRFAPDYDTAIQNFEAVCNRRLRVRQMQAFATLTTSGGAAQLPSDYLLWFSLHPPESTKEEDIAYVEIAHFNPAPYAAVSGRRIFSIADRTIWIYPIDDSGYYVFWYYRKIPSLVANPGNDNAANWLINDHPDLYLFGTLFELFVLGRNAEAGAAYKQMRDEKMAELIQLSSLTLGATSSIARQSAEFF